MNRPWMPLYVADYRADTAHLSAAEHGGYLLLIMHYWQTGSLPLTDAPLARIACMKPSEWRKAKPIIAAFFTAEWRHKRIDTEIARMVDVSTKRRAAAEQRYSKSTAIADANAQQLDTHLHSHKKQDAGPSGPLADQDADLFRRGKQILGIDSGGLIAKVKKSQNGSIPKARAVIETAATKQNPREYVGAVLRGATNSRGDFDDPLAGII